MKISVANVEGAGFLNVGKVENRWIVFDKYGVIHEGPKEEMERALFAMANGETSSEWWYDWVGDLRLAHVKYLVG